jgi:hypothetical protein
VRVLRALLRRLTGGDLREIRSEIRELRVAVDRIDGIVQQLNHELRVAAEDGPPLSIGLAERVRLDAETALASVRVIDRQLRRLGLEADGDDT